MKFVPARWHARAALPVLAIGLVLAILVTRGILRSRADRSAHLEEAYERLNKFDVALTHTAGAPQSPFQEMRINGSDRSYTVTTNDAEPRTCTAALSGAEAVTVLTALRNVEGLLLKDPFPCAGTLGTVQRRLDFQIIEALPPDSSGTLAITAACVEQYPALDEPFAAGRMIFEDGDHPLECN